MSTTIRSGFSPTWARPRDYFNSSLPGIALYYGMPTALKLMLFAVFAAAVAVGVIMLLRWRYSDPLFWMTTTSTLLLSGVFFHVFPGTDVLLE